MEKIMPQYTIKNKQTEEEVDVVCSWSDLQEALAEDKDLVQKVCAPKIISGVGTAVTRAGTNWRDLMGKIKKGSGKGNTVNT